VSKLTRRQFLYTTALSIVGLGIGVGVGVGYVEAKTIEVSRLDAGLGSKVAFLADPHIHGFGEVEERVVDLVAEEEPDIILLGGDVVDRFSRDMDAVAKYLPRLEAKEKYAVMGNHEYWSGKSGEMAKLLKDNKYEILNNSTASIAAGKIYGLDWREDRNYPHIKAEGIVLVHDPNAASNISGDCIILAGHTHGGLVIGGITIYTNATYTRGHYSLGGGSSLYVSRGLGQTLPLRPTSPLELVIIE
jgi:predicted MPP superfamily phosphohydrolase